MMNRRQLIKSLSLALTGTGLALSRRPAIAAFSNTMHALPKEGNGSEASAYLMAYFLADDQNLHYAISDDAKNWTALNGRKSVFRPGVHLRDPFIGRAHDGFHLVHTQGWDFPYIHHYASSDLIHWEGGPVRVVPDGQKRAWAPEWIYSEDEQQFYIYWASKNKGHNSIFYTTTKDWKDITPERTALFYDLGMDDIDLTITKKGNYYYGFHKPGSLDDNLSIALMRSPTLNPKHKDFGFGKNGSRPITTEVIKPIEGPEIIRLTGQQKWYLYADPFYNDFIAWETTDFENFRRIPASVPRGAKHCSMLAISRQELQLLLHQYPV